MISRKRLLVGFVSLILAVSVYVSYSFGQFRENTSGFGSQRQLSEILNPDGSLKLGSGVRGSFDPKGLRMITGQDGKPRFVPSGAKKQGDGGPALAAAGDENWDDQFGNFYANSDVYAIAASGNDVYVGGYFSNPVGYIGKWDAATATWSALGEGVNGYVRAIAISGTDVYVGGFFLNADDIEVNNIAKWDGAAWSALGSGVDGEVWSIAVSGADVYVGGVFTTAGGIPANRIAKWDGEEWSAIGGGVTAVDYPRVYAVAVSGTSVYVGGYFTEAGGISAHCVAKWDGEEWSALGASVGPEGYAEVYAIAVSGADVYVGGFFSEAGGLPAKNIAKWDGTDWSALGDGLGIDGEGYVCTIAISGSDVYAGGDFTAADEDLPDYVAKWDGNVWSALGSGVKSEAYVYCSVAALAVSGTRVYVGGYFTEAGGRQVHSLAIWDASTSSWPPVGSGVAGSVYAIAVNGTDVYVGGAFETVVGSPIPFLAKWDGTAWSGLGTPLSGQVYALAVVGTDLYAAGMFSAEGGFPADYIAKWDGASWSALGSGVNYSVFALAASGTDLYVGGYFTTAGGSPTGKIAKWDTLANQWSGLGGGVGGSGSWWEEWVGAIAISGGNIYAGGVFEMAGVTQVNHIAKWDGASWSSLGTGLEGQENNTSVHAITVAGTDIYVGGRFNVAGGEPANSIARWDGENWSAMGAGMGGPYYPDVNTIAVIGTNVYAGGAFTTADGDPANAIAKWDGLGWSALGSGLEGRPWYEEGSAVNALAMSGTGLYVGGDFIMAGGKASANLARWFMPLEVTAPNGGEAWEADSGQTVTWAGSAEAVKVEYSADNGASWTTLVESMANTGSLYGAAPNTPSSQCLIRISDTAFPGRSDISDGTFTITGFIVTSPNGGEQWTAGSAQTITWTTVGSFPTVKLLYSTTGGLPWTEIAASTDNTGSYPWTVPGTLSTQCLVRIRDGADNNPSDTSDAVFSIIPIPTITVTSPNGGETWAAGSQHDITWTYTGLTGMVTIDLYKGGVKKNTLGSADVAAGTFSWAIGTDESPGTDYRVLIWQGAITDGSDADFSIVSVSISRKVDFNGDGQEDILWRYYGTGGYNRAWFLGNSAEGGWPLVTGDAQMEAGSMAAKSSGKRAANVIQQDPRFVGRILGQELKRSTLHVGDVMGGIDERDSGLPMVDDPRRAGDGRYHPSRMSVADPRYVKLTLDPGISNDAPAELAAAPVLLGGADVMPVGDLTWKVVGTGNFNNDTHVDILWRNDSSGSNVVWFMNGTEWTASAELLPVGDLNWQIVGTGDFNKDAHVDILWRNSSSGENVVWYMNGVDWIGSAVLLGVSDPSWQIVGTGDFNKDGNVDILWRYNGAGGYNVVWYMNGATWTGSAELIPVGDTTWTIAGTGDYNNDANIDILWRYNGVGGYNVIWYMEGVAWSESAELLPVADLTWKIVSR
jgi:hypothetical protein